MRPATRLQASAALGQQQLAWKGIAPWVLEDAGVEEVDGVVWIPSRDETGRTLYCKAFHYARSWYEPSGIDLIPFGVERLPVSAWIAERSALLVTEGESDAFAAREAFVEGDSKILAWYVVALPGSGTWRRSWAEYVKAFTVVYLLGDGDDAGRRMNEAVWKDLPWARPVWLPEGRDVRAILQAGGREALLPFLREADYDALLAAALRASDGDVHRFERLVREGLES